MRRIRYQVAASLDGYIAGPKGEADWIIMDPEIDFAMKLLEEAEVAVSPGRGFGELGEGYLRLALVENEHRLRQAVRQIGRCLRDEKAAG